MLYELVSLSDQINALNVFRYITFRTGGAIMTALLFVFLFGPAIIDVLRIKQGKGRVLVICGITLATLLWAKWSHTAVWIGLAVLWAVTGGRLANEIGKLQRQRVVPAMTLSALLGLAAYVSGNAFIATGLHIPNIPAIAELTVMCGAIVGAGIACLGKESDGCCMSW